MAPALKKKTRGRPPRTTPWDPCRKLDDGTLCCSGRQRKECPKGCGQCENHCNCRFQPRSKPDKVRQPLGDVSNRERDCSNCKKSMCDRCNKCSLHCGCRRSQRSEPPPKTQAIKRSNRSDVEKAIAKSIRDENVADDGYIADSDDERKQQCGSSDKSSLPASNLMEDPESLNGVRIETFGQLQTAFDISYNQQKNMPSKKIRSDPNAKELLQNDKHGGRKISAMTNIAVDIILNVANILLPGDADFLLESVVERLDTKHGGGSRARRIETADAMVKSLFTICNQMPPQSKSYQVARAVIVNSGSQKNLNLCFGDLGPPKFGRTARRTAKADLSRIVDDRMDPSRKKRSCARVSDAIVKDAVVDILKPANVGSISWKLRDVPVPGTASIIPFPGLTRRRSLEEMYRNYRRLKEEQALAKANRVVTRKTAKSRTFVECLGRSSYISLASALTGDREGMTRSVDYCTDIHINERFNVMRRIVLELVAPSKKQEILHHLSIVQNELKNQYDDHVTRNDEVCSHGIEYALSLPPDPDDSVSDDEHEHECRTDVTSCRGCLYVEYVMRKLLVDVVSEARTEANSESVDDALRYIKDSLESIHLFQGHRMRVVNQQREINKVIQGMQAKVAESKEIGDECLLTVDWAMNYEGERKNENQGHHFGKRGHAWHVAHLLYYDWDPNKQEPVPVQVTLDQIVNNGNKKDGVGTLSLLECAMTKISQELPHIKSINLKSDNASNYHRKELVLAIPFLNAMSSSVRIVRNLHNETQDGKGGCDSHNAIAKRHVRGNFILSRDDATEYKKVDTPKQLATAIACKGGIQNNGVQLAEFDREESGRLDKIIEFMEPMAEQALEYFSRCNDIVYDVANDESAPWANVDLSDPANWPSVSYKIKVWAYSGIGEGATFQVDCSSKTFEYVPTDDLEGDGSSSVEGSSVDNSSVDNSSVDSSVDSSSSVVSAPLRNDDSLTFEDNDDDSSWGSEASDDLQDNMQALREARVDQDLDSELDSDCLEVSSGSSSDVDSDDSDNESDLDQDRPLEDAPRDIYDSSKTFTGVKVLMHQRFGRILCMNKKSKKICDESNSASGSVKVAAGGERSVLARGILIANEMVTSGEISIQDSKDENMKEYNLVDGWDVPEELLRRPMGWGRRPTREEGLYGTSYVTDEILEIVTECVQQGNRVSSEKMGSSRVGEIIEERFPGVYCLPGDTEISKTISTVVQRESKNKKGKPKKESKLPKWLLEKIREMMEKYPDETGNPIEKRLARTYGRRKGYNRKDVMEKVNAWRQAAKQKKKAERKRRIIG